MNGNSLADRGKVMGQQKDLVSRIHNKYGEMSKGQKALADYVLEKYDKAVFLTAAKLGETVKTSESTVVRFATFLGYKGYPEFQHALEELVRNRMNSVQRVEAASGRIHQSEILKEVLNNDAEKIRKTAESIDKQAFNQAVDTIIAARKIYIIGVRSCAPLASFLTYYMNLMFDNVHQLITSTSSELYEQMVHVNEQDVIIGISFPRYSKRTQKALEFAKNRGAKVIAITDSTNSPIDVISTHSLIASSDMVSIVDSLVAPLSVINALLAALCMKKQTSVVSTLTELERIWGEYGVYESNEIDDYHDALVSPYAANLQDLG